MSSLVCLVLPRSILFAGNPVLVVRFYNIKEENESVSSQLKKSSKYNDGDGVEDDKEEEEYNHGP